MKLQITLLSSLLFLAGGVVAQSNISVPNATLRINQSVAQEYKATSKPTTNNATKALGEVVWHDNFNNTMSGSGLGTSVPSAWVIENDGMTQTHSGFSIGTSIVSWFFPAGGFASTGGGNFLNLSNGETSATPNVGKHYTATSPVIDLVDLAGSSNVLLTFEQYGARFNDSSYVEVSTDGVTWESVYDNMHKAANVAGSQNLYPNPETVIVDLGEILGSTATEIQIRFGWTSAYPGESNPNAWVTYGWFVDNVKIQSKNDFDLEHTYSDWNINGYKYTQVPSSQVSDVTIRTGVKNLGTTPLTDITSTLKINGTDEETSAGITLAPLARDTMDITYALPNTVGTYAMTSELNLAETDDFLTNNTTTLSSSIAVSDHIYAIDNNTNFSSFPLESLQVGGVAVGVNGVGMSFDMFEDQDIYAIDFRFFTGSVVNTAEVYGELYKYNTAAGVQEDLWGGIIAETEMFLLTATNQINQIHTLKFENPVTLEAGETYLVLIKFASGVPSLKIAASGSNQNGQAWIHTDHQSVWFTFTQAPVVRANFDPSVSVNSVAEGVTGVSVFPNPATDKVSVDFNLTAASDVTVEVADINGKVMTVKQLNNAVVGSNNVELNVDGFAAGVYTVAIKSNLSNVTRKIIVQ